ncbi:hypothetical protein F2P79_009136 [Pimephales promelas]|nr:hypothetical protein F2P79_009136 [Pimephales promelas]
MTNVMKGCDEYFMYDPYEGKREGKSRRDAVLGSANDTWRLTDKQTDRQTDRKRKGREGGRVSSPRVDYGIIALHRSLSRREAPEENRKKPKPRPEQS